MGSSPLRKAAQHQAMWPVGLILVYFGWLVMTPYTRFPILTDIRFERILMALGWLMVMFSGRMSAPNRICGTYLLLICWMYLSLLFSPYPDLNSVEEWLDSYWKLAVLFFLIFCAIQGFEELTRFLLGAALVLFAYEGYSLLNFAMGGSYVWQQGVRRAVGVWSRGGLGAPNFFGVIGVFLIPFAIYFAQASRSRWRRQGAVAMLLVAFLAIVLSGTRAALLTGLVMVLVFYRKSLRRFKMIIIWGGLLMFGLSFLSGDMRERYISIIPGFDSNVSGVASRSAQSRIAGLQDGWRLFLKRPIVGFGPESSGYARLEVSSFTDEPLQLHSLYGQVLGELGVVGALIFFLLLRQGFQVTDPERRIPPGIDPPETYRLVQTLLRQLLFVSAFYGLFSHNLYAYYWVMNFSLIAVFLRLDGRAPGAGSKRLPSTNATVTRG